MNKNMTLFLPKTLYAKRLLLSLAAVLLSTSSGVYAGDNNSKAHSKNNTQIKLQQAAQGAHRSTQNKTRNQYRHPLKTLEFFALADDMTVVEIWPGGGWYSEILAPVLKEQGKYYSAGFSLTAKRTPDWKKNYQKKYLEKLKQQPDIYQKTVVTDLAIPERPEIAPEGTADLVLTFRNVHNWMKGDYAQQVFNSAYKALKKGGVFGVVEHRAKPGTSIQDMITSGYVTEAYVIELAEKAGFKLQAKSEVNANKKDSTLHPKGVWTLPPSLRLAEQDKEKYLTIGESDRMTLKFVK